MLPGEIHIGAVVSAAQVPAYVRINGSVAAEAVTHADVGGGTGFKVTQLFTAEFVRLPAQPAQVATQAHPVVGSEGNAAVQLEIVAGFHTFGGAEVGAGAAAEAEHHRVDGLVSIGAEVPAAAAATLALNFFVEIGFDGAHQQRVVAVAQQHLIHAQADVGKFALAGAGTLAVQGIAVAAPVAADGTVNSVSSLRP